MEDRLSKQQVLQRLHTEHDRLQATLAQLTPDRLTQPGAVGVWSVKDVLAHLVYWNRFPVNEVEAALQGNPMIYPDFSSGDEENAAAVAVYTDRSWDEVRTDFETTYHAIIQTIEGLDESQFTADSPLEMALGETIHGTFNNNTYDHYALHEAQIRIWMRTLSR